MIKLTDPGERGGNLTVSLSPFDILSLQEAISRSSLYNHKKIDKYNEATDERKAEMDKSARALFGKSFLDVVAVPVRDDKLNYQELQAVLDERNAALD